MEKIGSFNALIERSIRENWTRPALTDHKGATLHYRDVARKIEKLHLMLRHAGVRPGDKVALFDRNSSMWAVAFLATLSYGAVAVPIQSEFTPDQVHHIVNHSDARLLFVGEALAPTLNWAGMPALEGMLLLGDCSLLQSRSERLTYAREHLNELFGQKHPKHFRREHVAYHADQPDELALINYTSGTTGFSKGVMLPYRSLWSNMDYLMDEIGRRLPEHSRILCILPMAHMYGLSVEVLMQLCMGNHLHFLTRLPSPSVIQQAFQDVRPAIVVSVPLIIEKIVRKSIFPIARSPRMRLMLGMPVLRERMKRFLYNKVMETMGGQAYEVMIGGASFSKEIEDFFTGINFPVTVGYGTTETGPMLTFSDHTDFAPGSCGTAAKHMEVKVLSADPDRVPGEIVARGPNVMLGYYKNEEATREVIDAEGWFHTGDLGRMSPDGHFYILGRIKNILLSSSGQNVFPDEIEHKLNAMPLVNESLVVQRGNRFVALVCPDREEVQALGLTEEELHALMQQHLKTLNGQLPKFSRVSEIRLHPEEFEKTPKKSIKRYLYQEKS